MKKKKYALIGYPLEHSISPFIHERLFNLAGIDADYDLMEVAPEKLSEKIGILRALDGFNITLPHKQTMVRYLDNFERTARLYGSINTVHKDEKGQLWGHTTDGTGFVESLEAKDIPFFGRVVVLGCGGVARTIVYHAVIKGCETTVAVRNEDLRDVATFAGELHSNVIGAQVDTTLISRLDGQIDLLINATPAGMYPYEDSCAISDEQLERILPNCGAVVDVIYNPLETKFLRLAREYGGIKTMNGVGMLVRQAAEAHRVWNGSVYKEEDIREIVRASEALIGGGTYHGTGR